MYSIFIYRCSFALSVFGIHISNERKEKCMQGFFFFSHFVEFPTCGWKGRKCKLLLLKKIKCQTSKIAEVQKWRMLHLECNENQFFPCFLFLRQTLQNQLHTIHCSCHTLVMHFKLDNDFNTFHCMYMQSVWEIFTFFSKCHGNPISSNTNSKVSTHYPKCVCMCVFSFHGFESLYLFRTFKHFSTII